MSQPALRIFVPENTTVQSPLEMRDAHRLLVVDDDEMMVESLKEVLIQQGYDVRGASHGREALNLLREEAFAVILSDHRMPHMSGLELLAETKVIQPNITRILMTGVVNLQTVIEAINKGEIYRFIAKPWRQEDLIMSVRNGVQRYELVCRNQELQKTTQAMNQQLAALNQCLEEKIQLETLQSHQMTELNRALSQNFQRCASLCFKTMQTLYPELGQQTRRVQGLCRLMVDELHLPDDQAQLLETSAWLHDIGLVGLPQDLIRQWQTNPASLSSAQVHLLESHPILGQELASFVHDLAETGRIIRSHHERWDGHGFPDGLAGEEIPWLSRLIGAAAALVSHGTDQAAALEQIRQGNGSAFDPETIQVLESCLKRLALPRPEQALPLVKLQPGMVLARDIFTAEGLLLAPAEQVLCEAWINRLLRYHRVYPLLDAVSVYA
jgi:response regulator RpfG family c-di-GMP phosphodiesterase